VPASFRAACLFVNSNDPQVPEILLRDQASQSNAATCYDVCKALGYERSQLEARFKTLQPLALRLEIKNGIGDSMIINDYYNSDLDSLRIALNFLNRQNRKPRSVVIVSDIEQSGLPPGELYAQIASLLKMNRVNFLVGIGEEISSHQELFGTEAVFFKDTDHFVREFPSVTERFRQAGILLKGARSFGFEKISKLLQQKSHDTVFEVNLNRLTDNVNYYRSLLKKNVKLMCMVKAMGYGSGSAEIARILEHMGVAYLAVAYADEGVELRESLVSLPIMVMSPEEDALDDLILHRLEPEIYSFRMLELFQQALDSNGITEPYPIHIKIDTGRHRLGFGEAELDDLAARLAASPGLMLRTVFSHLAASDSPGLDQFTNEQIRIFEKACSTLEAKTGQTFLKHICNSAGISRFPAAHFDMVRLGIGMYGIGHDEAEQRSLFNVGTLRTRISQIKTVEKGDTVGYSRNGKVERKTKIATIPIGYADGFGRQLGNGRHGVYINGTFCPTIGNICMDMCMIDITPVDCSEGDEVIIFETVSQINDLARALNTISYEVLTNVSGRVKRVYVNE
jgi:alanine racemase